MKKMISIFMTAIILILAVMPVTALAEDNGEEYNDIRYDEYYDEESHTYYRIDKKGNAVITGIKYDFFHEFNDYLISDTINGHTVTKIAFNFYYDSMKLPFIIPKTVKSFNGVFVSCIRDSARRYPEAFEVRVFKNSFAQKYMRKHKIRYWLIEKGRFYSDITEDADFYDTNGNKLALENGCFDLPNYTRTGKDVKPRFTIKLKSSGKKLKKNVDYTVKYYNNFYPGEAVAIVKPLKYYFTQGVNLYFKIVPERLEKLEMYEDYPEEDSEYLSLHKNYYPDDPWKIQTRWSDSEDFTKILSYNKNLNEYSMDKKYYAKQRAVIKCPKLKRVNGKFGIDFTQTWTIKGRWSKTVSGIPSKLKHWYWY